MERVLKGLGGLALLALVVVLWRWDASPNGAALGPPVARPEDPAAPGDGPEALPSEAQSSANARASVDGAPRAQAAEHDANVEPDAPKLVLRARLLDPQGRPIAGARLTAADVEGQPSVESRSDGWAQLELDWPMRLTVGNSSWAVVEAGGEGLTKVRREERIDGPCVVQFGEIRLSAGGRIRGRVLDHDGTPLKGGGVFLVQGAERGDPVLEDLRRTRAEGFGSLHAQGGRHALLDAEGRYVIEGVPPVPVSVVCGAWGRYTAYTPPLEVRPGEEGHAPDLILEPVRGENTIRGVVLDEAGESVVGAEVHAFENRGARNIDPQAMGRSGGSDGSFELVVPLGRRFTLEVEHPTRRGIFVLAHDVESGTQGLELRFPVARTIEFHLLDREGNAVETPYVSFSDEEGYGMSMRPEPLADGGVVVSVPAVPFYAYANARGHLGQRLGPFDPATVAERVEVVLERAGGLRGRVTFAGSPVPGAKVHLHTPPEGQPFSTFSGELVTRFGGTYWNREFVEADAEGRFELFLRVDGTYTLHAQSQGLARAESPAYTLRKQESVEGIELELATPASIEGRVLVAEGVDSLGILVGATRGDGHVQLCETTSDGSYRFEGLAAGGWQLARCRPSDREWLEMGRTWPAPGVDELPVHVRVGEGESVRYDLDLTHERLCVLRGSLAFDGVAATGWSAQLATRDDHTSITLGSDGRFDLQVRTTGACFLRLRSGALSGGELSLQQSLALEAGANTWQRDFDTGRLRIEGLAPSSVSGEDRNRRTYELQWQPRDGEPTMSFAFEPDADRVLDVAGLPAGQVTLQRYVAVEGRRDAASQEVQAFEIVAGRLTSIDYAGK